MVRQEITNTQNTFGRLYRCMNYCSAGSHIFHFVAAIAVSVALVAGISANEFAASTRTRARARYKVSDE